MTEALTFVCVLTCGALAGSALTGWLLWRASRNAEVIAGFVSHSIRLASTQQGITHLSTVDSEGRLVLLPVDRLAQSLETQLVLWFDSVPARPPERIHFDPPEGSS